MAHNSINSEVAAQKMIEHGVRPLEPYTSSSAHWKCECLECGAVVYPRYGTVVTAGKGGCHFCAKKKAAATRNQRIREVDFPKACVAAGVTALTEFKNAFEKIDLRCNACGHQFRMVWSPLRDGRGCPKCSRARSLENLRAKHEAEARTLLISADVTPLGPFKGMSKPFPGHCVGCGRKVSPKPSQIKSGQGGCLRCGQARAGLARRTPREKALEIMASRQIEIHPEEPYPGNSKPWPGKCMRCGLPVASTVGNARQGRGGCRVCHSLESDSAFDFFGPAILYLIASDSFRAFKIGIAGKETTRLAAHKSAGWDRIIYTFEALGYEVNYVEQYVLSWLRDEMGVADAVSNEDLPASGGTETWAFDTVSPEEVWGKAVEQFEKRNWPVPRAVLLGTAQRKARRGCSVIEDGKPCELPYSQKGFCRLHHSRWKKYGDPLQLQRKTWDNEYCEVVEGGQVCGRGKQSRGMCQTHYWRDWANGSPTALKRPTPQPRKGVCTVAGCVQRDYSLGFCTTHYHEQRRRDKRRKAGLPDPVKYESETCEVEGCSRKRSSLGMCHLHYSRTKKHGSPHLAGRGPRMMEKLGNCRAEGCAEPDAQKGLCLTHYSREYKRKRRGVPSLLDG